MKAPREIFLPGPETSHWLHGGKPPGGLLYLGWGRRQFGVRPIPLRLHHGWTYTIVLSGRPVFMVGDTERKVGRGNLLILGPDVPYGWRDRPEGECELLVWVWSGVPVLGNPLNPRACWIRKAGDDTLAELEDLHRRTRREIQHPDSRSSAMLVALQGFLDAACARSQEGSGGAPERDGQRLQLAQEWMHRHLDARAPVAALADYLGISLMGLQRLFHRLAGMSPGRAFLELKLREAADMLSQPGATVKAVGLSLGYRHPGDFTRAYTRFYGRPPSSKR